MCIVHLSSLGRDSEQVLLDKFENLHQLVVGAFAFKLLHEVCHMGLDLHQVASNHLFITCGVVAQCRWHHVVNVLDKNHIGLAVVEVLNERTMSSGAEQQRAVFLAIGRVVGHDRDGIGRCLLLAHCHSIGHAPHFLHQWDALCQQSLKLLAVLGRDGKVQVDITLCVSGILRSFLKVFLNGCVYTATCSLVELQQALGQATIVQSIRLEQRASHIGMTTSIHQLEDIHVVAFHAGLVQGGVEGKLLHIAEECALKVGLWGHAARVDKGVQVLEHAAGCSRSGHEFFYGATKSFPRLDATAFLLGR